MPPDILAQGFARDYERCRARVHELAAPLSDEAFWTKPFGFGNSFGHLVLHVTGNLNYYIGAQVAGTGYVRTRDREFTDPEQRPKDGVLRDFDAAVDMVLQTIAAQRAEQGDWSAAYSGEREPDAHNRFDIFLKCAMHFYHHVGQMVYLQRQLSDASLSPGHPQVGIAAPLLIVRSVPATLAFYRDKLGFEITFQGPEPNDIFFGIVERGRAMIMFKDVDVEPVPNCTRDIGHGIARWDAYIDVPDPDTLAAEFASRGVEFSEPLRNNDDNLRGFEITDVNGYRVYFGRPNS